MTGEPRSPATPPDTRRLTERPSGGPTTRTRFPASRLPPSVRQLLDEFREVYRLDASLWVRIDVDWECVLSTGASTSGTLPDDAVVVDFAGEMDAVVSVSAGEGSHQHAHFLSRVVARAFRHEEESRFFGREIAERYEEITLLYSISEILGSVISLEEAASTILQEVAGTLVVERAALWLHDPANDSLELIAAVGTPGQPGPIRVGDESSITASVFRDRQPINLEPVVGRTYLEGAAPRHAVGSLLSVPVSYSPPDGEARTIGVINLIGRSGGHHFSAGDQKLIMAIASQIGAAVENSRLVEESLRQERMVREMELAHDLQLKLLPSLDQFDGYARVAARCVPAESVGGDFYHLFRLPGQRLGVVIGDVSSHGFGAALIMALTMSAIAIHASEGDSPSEVLRRTHGTIIDELETTEMYLTLFYGVIDANLGQITYSNAGHAHAFRIADDGTSVRLSATNPPLGITDLDTYGEERAPWNPDSDLLLLFTDGLSDALDLGEIGGPAVVVQEAAEHRHLEVAAMLDRLFELRGGDGAPPVDDRTAVLVRF